MPLDSDCATAMLSVQSGLRLKVKSVVSPISARNVIGCVRRKVSNATTPVTAKRGSAWPSSCTLSTPSFQASV